MKTKDVVFGGVLAAAGITMLYMGAATKVVAVAACVLAGVLTAFPIAYGNRKLAFLVYVVTGAVSLVVLPSKVAALLYCLLTGVYPIVKSMVQGRFGRYTALAVKLAYWNAFVLLFIAITCRVLLPALSNVCYIVIVDGMPKIMQVTLAAAFINVAFFIYDFVLSRCGDVLHHIASRK